MPKTELLITCTDAERMHNNTAAMRADTFPNDSNSAASAHIEKEQMLTTIDLLLAARYKKGQASLPTIPVIGTAKMNNGIADVSI